MQDERGVSDGQSPSQSKKSDDQARAFGSYGQLFQSPTPKQLLRPGQGRDLIGGPATLITCWGSGKLNLRRARPAAMKTFLGPPLGLKTIEQLIKRRNQQRRLTVDRAIALIQPSRKVRKRLQSLLTDTSQCHSLWQTLRKQERRWDRLAVSVKDSAETDQGQDADDVSPNVQVICW
jgi:hypothetical protein